MTVLSTTSSRSDHSEFLSPIEEVIEDARNGKMFILVDAEERENEGDLVIPAQMATPDAINFMAKHGRGLICLALTQERAKQLRLELMSRSNLSRLSTAFTVSIEAREGGAAVARTPLLLRARELSGSLDRKRSALSHTTSQS